MRYHRPLDNVKRDLQDIHQFFSDARIWNWKPRWHIPTRKHFFRRYSSRLLCAVTPTGPGTETQSSNFSDLPIPGEYRSRPLQSVYVLPHRRGEAVVNYKKKGARDPASRPQTTPSRSLRRGCGLGTRLWSRLATKALPACEMWTGVTKCICGCFWVQISDNFLWKQNALFHSDFIQSDQWFCMANKTHFCCSVAIFRTTLYKNYYILTCKSDSNGLSAHKGICSLIWCTWYFKCCTTVGE